MLLLRRGPLFLFGILVGLGALTQINTAFVLLRYLLSVQTLWQIAWCTLIIDTRGFRGQELELWQVLHSTLNHSTLFCGISWWRALAEPRPWRLRQQMHKPSQGLAVYMLDLSSPPPSSGEVTTLRLSATRSWRRCLSLWTHSSSWRAVCLTDFVELLIVAKWMAQTDECLLILNSWSL